MPMSSSFGLRVLFVELLGLATSKWINFPKVLSSVFFSSSGVWHVICDVLGSVTLYDGQLLLIRRSVSINLILWECCDLRQACNASTIEVGYHLLGGLGI